MERKIWACETCEAEVQKPFGGPPEGWAQAVTFCQSRRIHICPRCLPKVTRQLNEQS